MIRKKLGSDEIHNECIIVYDHDNIIIAYFGMSKSYSYIEHEFESMKGTIYYGGFHIYGVNDVQVFL